MQEKIKNTFSNSCFLKCFGVLAAILSVVQVVMCVISKNYFLSFEMCVATITVIATVIASMKVPESANIPIAATMMLYLLRFAERFFNYLTYPNVSDFILAATALLPILMAILMFLHLAMHLTSNRERLVKVQQAFYIIVVLYGIAMRCNGAISSGTTFDAASYVISGLALAFTYLALCSAEIRQ